MDRTQLIAALTAGATIVGTELVKEATKDAYRSLKATVAHLFGRYAERAVEKVEISPVDPSARQALKDALPAIDCYSACNFDPLRRGIGVQN